MLVEPTGFEITAARIVIVFVVAVTAPCLTFTVTVELVLTPTSVAPVKSIAVTVPAAVSAALEGATESRPNPIDATATSATRLKVVFVDICFLSISRSEEFPPVGFG
jgi:hypothetical protein